RYEGARHSGRHQRVFDGRGTAFLACETRKKPYHDAELRRPFDTGASQSTARFDIVAQFAKIERNSLFSAPGAGVRNSLATGGNRGAKRTDREIAQPQIGKKAPLPDPEQRPIERQAYVFIAFLDNNSDASAEGAAGGVGPAAKGTAILGIGAVEPERERDRIAEQEIDVAAPQREPRQVRARIGANLDLGKQGLKIS